MVRWIDEYLCIGDFYGIFWELDGLWGWFGDWWNVFYDDGEEEDVDGEYVICE